MGFSIVELEEDDTRVYTLQMMVTSLEQFRTFIFELLLHNGLVSRADLQPTRPIGSDLEGKPITLSAAAAVRSNIHRLSSKNTANRGSGVE